MSLVKLQDLATIIRRRVAAFTAMAVLTILATENLIRSSSGRAGDRADTNGEEDNIRVEGALTPAAGGGAVARGVPRPAEAGPAGDLPHPFPRPIIEKPVFIALIGRAAGQLMSRDTATAGI